VTQDQGGEPHPVHARPHGDDAQHDHHRVSQRTSCRRVSITALPLGSHNT
jgi:hypothetical protein